MKIITTLIMLTMIAGCASSTSPDGLTERETGALGGGALGAGIGAIVGNQTGHAGAGTAIGAGAGALTGALIGEAQRRQKEAIKQEMRQEMMTQQYQHNTPQYGASQPQVQQLPQGQQQEVHTKYNPRTAETFPEQFQFDPKTGEQLKYIK